MTVQNNLLEYIRDYYNKREKNDVIRQIRIKEKYRDIIEGISEDILKEIKLKDIIALPIEKIGRESFKEIIQRENERKNRLNNVSYTKAYKCYKCGNNETTVIYVQTRSSDEPMTAFITCVHCKNQFKN